MIYTSHVPTWYCNKLIREKLHIFTKWWTPNKTCLRQHTRNIKSCGCAEFLKEISLLIFHVYCLRQFMQNFYYEIEIVVAFSGASFLILFLLQSWAWLPVTGTGSWSCWISSRRRLRWICAACSPLTSPGMSSQAAHCPKYFLLFFEVVC